MAIRRRAMEYRSEQVWGDLPVVHVSIGGRQADGRYRLGRARGIIALGDIATGLVAVGGVAIGLFSVGGVAVGLVAWVRWPSGWWPLRLWPSGCSRPGGGDRADSGGCGHGRAGWDGLTAAAWRDGAGVGSPGPPPRGRLRLGHPGAVKRDP
jgi:hypothetical protein